MTYDEQDGWDYHRNGIAGWGFYVRLDDGTIQVRFTNETDDGENVTVGSIDVSVPFLVQMSEAGRPYGEWAPIGWRGTCRTRPVAAFADTVGVVIFDCVEKGDPDRRMVALTTGDPQDCMTAVFDLDIIEQGSVEWLRNSWRGDNFHDFTLATLASAEHAA